MYVAATPVRFNAINIFEIQRLSMKFYKDCRYNAFIMLMIILGVPAMVPNIAVNNSTARINGNIVTHLRLSWGEPFNNLDPIANYTVSCSSDGQCPSNFTTTDNTTRSYTITNLTTMTTYTFSVIATNSIGSGEAGVVMFTTPPGEDITDKSSYINVVKIGYNNWL